MTHCGVVIDSTYFIESDIKVWISPLTKLRDVEYYEIWECPNITEAERLIVKDTAISFFGRYYSILKLGMHAIDALLGKLLSRDIFLFRRLSKNDRYAICSWIVAYAYVKIGFDFTIPYYAATPEDIHKFVKKYHWSLIEKRTVNAHAA